MPMLDAFIPEGALDSAAENELLSKLTDILLRKEGADPSNPAQRSIAWVFVHRPASVFVAGEPSPEPRYRIVASVPEGQFDEERRNAMVAEVTEAVLAAERGSRTPDPSASGCSQARSLTAPGVRSVASIRWPTSRGSRWATARRAAGTPNSGSPKGTGRGRSVDLRLRPAPQRPGTAWGAKT
jgi:phenylpyruvate tautomerase PptA (4-oxalocrotonate tautomerase family)